MTWDGKRPGYLRGAISNWPTTDESMERKNAMTDTTPRVVPDPSRSIELAEASGREAAPARARYRLPRRTGAVVLAMFVAWTSGSSIPAFAAQSAGQDSGTTGATPGESAASAATMLAEGLLATIPPGSRLAVRPLYERETRLPPEVGKRLYESVLNAMAHSAPRRQTTVLTRDRLREVYDTLDEFGQGNASSMLRAAQADVEVICRVFPTAEGVTLSCGAVDLATTDTVAHAEASFAMERPLAPLPLAVTDIADAWSKGCGRWARSTG